MNHILQDKSSVPDFTLGCATPHYTIVLELTSKHSFIWLPSAMVWPLSLPGWRREISSQLTEVSQGSTQLLGASYWALPTKGLGTSVHMWNHTDEEGQEHHILVSWDVFLLFALKFLTIQLPCGQGTMSASSLLRWYLRRFPNISIYPKLYVLPFPTQLLVQQGLPGAAGPIWFSSPGMIAPLGIFQA